MRVVFDLVPLLKPRPSPPHALAPVSFLCAGAKKKETVKGIIEKARKGQLDPEPGMTLRETFEAMINKALNETRNESGKKAMESLKKDNNFKQMIAAGSKGSEINISQIAACVGQQNVEGTALRPPVRREHRPLLTRRNAASMSAAHSQAHSVRLTAAHPAALPQGRLPARVARLRRKLVPAWPPAARVFLPRHGRARRAHRHGREDVRDRVHPASACQGT